MSIIFNCNSFSGEIKMNRLKLLYFYISLFTFIECSLSRTAPVWSKTYSVSGSLYLPYTELLEPFNAWYDAEEKNSRIDYYQGMVKTYQLGNVFAYGSQLQIVPVTTEDYTNVAKCIQSNGTESSPVTPQAILPDLTKFKFVGIEVMNGYRCEVWRESDVNFERTSTYTIWLRWKKNPKSPSMSQPIPVRYEMKGYNSLIGSHYDHYYLNYENFDLGKPPTNVFQLSENISCKGLDEFREHHHQYNSNPMKEFIDRRTDHVDHAWEQYKTSHGKSYDTHHEHADRKQIFNHNLRYIHSTNRQGAGYTLKINHLADRSESELRRLRGGVYEHGHNSAQEFPYSEEQLQRLSADMPENFDWRIRGAVTPVKDQATCGSCWSFSTVGAMEGAYFLKNGKLLRFSEQALVDCTWGFGNNGCDGGSHESSFEWIKKHGGIPTDEDYGYYLGQDGYCHTETVNLTASITGFFSVTPNNETAMRVALFNHGPISVFIDASHKSFSFYSNGVYYEPQCKSDVDDLDHVVLLIGYGTLKGQNYWLIKNSWSNHWGNQGYVLMSTKGNNCGVMTIPMYVTM